MALMWLNYKKSKENSPFRGVRALLVGAICLFVAACAAAPGYRPASSSSDMGYSERKLSGNRYEVTFTGAVNTALAEVRRSLMRRIAEVTLAQGYSHFVIFTSRSEAEVYQPPDTDFTRSDHGLGKGYVRDIGGRYSTSAGWPLAEYRPGDPTPKARYIASAEIILLKGADAMRNPDAVSARMILDRDVTTPAGGAS